MCPFAEWSWDGSTTPVGTTSQRSGYLVLEQLLRSAEAVKIRQELLVYRIIGWLLDFPFQGEITQTSD